MCFALDNNLFSPVLKALTYSVRVSCGLLVDATASIFSQRQHTRTFTTEQLNTFDGLILKSGLIRTWLLKLILLRLWSK